MQPISPAAIALPPTRSVSLTSIAAQILYEHQPEAIVPTTTEGTGAPG